MTIDIDTSLPCFSPRLSAQEKAEEAMILIAHDIISLHDALKKGATLSAKQADVVRALAVNLMRIRS